jgi:DHA2 family multidrug resistance protein
LAASLRLEPGNPAFENLVNGISPSLQNSRLEATAATQQAYGRVMAMLQAQATTLAYAQVITLMAIIVGCLIPLPMIMRRPPKGKPAGEVAMHRSERFASLSCDALF